jgi:hypothetical protein
MAGHFDAGLLLFVNQAKGRHANIVKMNVASKNHIAVRWKVFLRGFNEMYTTRTLIPYMCASRKERD